jgi:hypothetical protein
MTGNTQTGKSRLRPDGERARSWLERQLEWEQILTALRDAGRAGAGRDPSGPE